MKFQSILFADSSVDLRKEEPDFFHDLQLDYLLERILESTKGYQTAIYYYTLPMEKSLISYRQQIGRDMESEELCRAIREFCRNLKESRSMYDFSLQSKGEVQAATYHLQAANLYWNALLVLERQLHNVNVSSEGLCSFIEYVKEEIESKKEHGFENALWQANQIFSQLSFSVSIDTERLVLEEGDKGQGEEEKKGSKKEKEFQTNYFVELAKLLGYDLKEEESSMKDIFPDPLELSYLETMLIGLLKKSKPEVFRELRTFKEKFSDMYSKVLLRFEEEIQFYLSFQEFRKKTVGKGYPLQTPVLSENGECVGEGVYDIALVWKQEDKEYQVVSNEFTMKKYPSFFVVTGPNQGGKTTFARSMGQAVYFSLMGLPANAESFTTPLFQGISTHFEAEETLQSNSGKLKEEINRLIPMMARVQNRRHFVILNELFTTATTHDAMIMGRKVMDSFLQRECYGIYVTHIQELAEETEKIISLVAQLAPGEESKRTFRILPMKAQGYGYSEALVKKFHLEYADIVRRLS